MKNRDIDRNGIYSALITPYDNKGNVNISELRNLIKYEIDKGVEGFYCCGSSGEGLLLEKEERMKIVETVSEETTDIPFIVHTGSLSTKVSIELSKHAQSCGASAVSMIPPIYYNYSVEEIASHYKSVMDSIDIGVIVYNIPQYTGISFSKSDSFLKDDRIVGIKHTSMNLYELERIKQAYPNKIFFNGFDEIYLSSLTAGATATIGTTVNICPALYKGIRKAFNDGNILQAQNLQHRANDLIETLVKTSVFPGAKFCMELLGINVNGCREPFAKLTDEQKILIENELKEIKEFL